MEVDAEQLMLINSKAKEEADRAAALASQQNTPQTPHSTHSFQADSSQTAASARSVEHQHQMNVPSNSICMMQSQMMQQQSQTQQIQQQQQQPQMQQQPHSQQSQPTIASPYHQMQQPLSMQHTQSRHVRFRSFFLNRNIEIKVEWKGGIYLELELFTSERSKLYCLCYKELKFCKIKVSEITALRCVELFKRFTSKVLFKTLFLIFLHDLITE